MSRPVAAERAARLLSIAPWIASLDGPTIGEVCTRFEIDRDELLSDLGVLSMVGVPPYSPDALVDVLVEDDRVWVTLGPYFRRPMRLSPAEGMALVGAASILGSGDDALARASAKLSRVIGDGTLADAVVADLGDVPDNSVQRLSDAVSQRRRVRLDYYGYGSDERTVREVDPYRLHVADGHWYLAGYCHRAEAERLFRLDRVHALEVLDSTFEPPEHPVTARPFSTTPDETVTLRLQPDVRWVLEGSPVVRSAELAGGVVEVELVVGGRAWLERLLLRIGARAEIVGGTVGGEAVDADRYIGVRSAAAQRILRRYGGDSVG